MDNLAFKSHLHRSFTFTVISQSIIVQNSQLMPFSENCEEFYFVKPCSIFTSTTQKRWQKIEILLGWHLQSFFLVQLSVSSSALTVSLSLSPPLSFSLFLPLSLLAVGSSFLLFDSVHSMFGQNHCWENDCAMDGRCLCNIWRHCQPHFSAQG